MATSQSAFPLLVFSTMVEAHVQYVISPESREKYPLLVEEFVVGLTLAEGEPLAAVVVKAATVKIEPAEKPGVAAATPADIAAPSSLVKLVASMELPVESLELC